MAATLRVTKTTLSFLRAVLDMYIVPQRHYAFVLHGHFKPAHALPFYWIINLDKTGHGTHWTVLWTKDGKSFFYVDSFGLKPDKQTQTFVKMFSLEPAKLWYSSTRIQDYLSGQCGVYVLYAMATAGITLWTFQHWIKMWDPYDIVKNENKVASWLQSIVKNKQVFLYNE